MDSTTMNFTELESLGEDLGDLEMKDAALDAGAWEWTIPFVSELPCGIHASDMIFSDAPIVAVAGRQKGQPLTERICFISRIVVPSGVDVAEDIEVLFAFFDTTVSFEREESGAVRQRLYESLRTLGFLPAPDEVWECSIDEFKSNAKFFNRLYRGVLAKDADKIAEALELVAFAFPYEAERFVSFKTWQEAVTELERVTGLLAVKEIRKIYNTEAELEKFKGFKLE